jgi:hypothetical protein
METLSLGMRLPPAKKLAGIGSPKRASPAPSGCFTRPVNTDYAIVNTLYGNPQKLFTITPIPCSRSSVIAVHDPP